MCAILEDRVLEVEAELVSKEIDLLIEQIRKQQYASA